MTPMRLRLSTTAFLVLPIVLPGCTPPDAQVGRGHFGDGPATLETRTVSFTEGTELVAELSPDGRWIAFILLGEVWLVDGSGGPAVQLTSSMTDPHETQAIAWAPDSRRLAVSTYYAERPGRHSCISRLGQRGLESESQAGRCVDSDRMGVRREPRCRPATRIARIHRG